MAEHFDAVVIGGATAQSSGIVRTHCSVAPNVAVARARLSVFQRVAEMLDDTEADAGLVRSWSGLYDTTPDWNPVPGPGSGPVPGPVPGIGSFQRAFGFSGHGFKPLPTIGRMLARSLLWQQPDLPLHPYRLTRFAEGDLPTATYGTGAVS